MAFGSQVVCDQAAGTEEIARAARMQRSNNFEGLTD